MKNETKQTLFALHEAGQDIEWFPTTPEILQAINSDLLEISCEQHRHSGHNRYSGYNRSSQDMFFLFQNVKILISQKRSFKDER